MLILWKTRFDRYCFFDDIDNRVSLIGYDDVISAYSAFPRVSTTLRNLPTSIKVIATSPDYTSFPTLYPEFFI